jgi:predicted kinase
MCDKGIFKMKPTLFATLGLPGSGKSTWARRMTNIFNNTCEDRGRIVAVQTCKDDIREELHKGVWSKENEREVVAEQDRKIRSGLQNGADVYVHDTNFFQKDRLKKIAAECAANIVFVDFTHVPIEDCIARDAKRIGKAHVGEQVIRRMAASIK